MDQSGALNLYKILIHVKLREGVGWYRSYSVVARDTEDVTKITKQFAEFFGYDCVVPDEVVLVGNAEVDEPRSMRPSGGRAIYDESETGSPELQYHTLKWPWSWLFRRESNRMYRKFNKMLANG